MTELEAEGLLKEATRSIVVLLPLSFDDEVTCPHSVDD